MIELGDAIVRLMGDDRSLKQVTANAGTYMKSLGTSLSSIASKAGILGTAIGLALGGISKKFLDLAMSAVESENLFEVSFGEMADAARLWSEELARTLGISEHNLRRMSGTFYVMLSSMGLSSDEALNMSEKLTELTYDMASFYNLPTEQAFEKIQAGITGEMEPLKRLGIILSETRTKQWALTHGMGQATKEVKDQTDALRDLDDERKLAEWRDSTALTNLEEQITAKKELLEQSERELLAMNVGTMGMKKTSAERTKLTKTIKDAKAAIVDLEDKLAYESASYGKNMRSFDDRRAKLTDQAKGEKELSGELSDTEKILARYNLLLQDTTKAQGDMARTLGSPANQLRILGDQWKELGITIGTLMLPVAQRLITWGREHVSQVRDWIAANKDQAASIAQLAAEWGLLFVVLGPALFILPLAIGLMKDLYIATRSLAGLGALAVGFGNPWLGAALLIAGAVALVILNWDKIKDWLPSWDSIKNDLIMCWEQIETMHPALAAWVEEKVLPAWERVKTWVNEDWPKIKDNLIAVWEWVRDAAAEIWNKIKTDFESLKDGFDIIWTNIKDLFKSAWADLSSPEAKAFYKWLGEGVKIALESFLDALKGVIQFFAGDWKGGWDSWCNAWYGFFDWLSVPMVALFQSVMENWGNWMTWLKGMWAWAVDGIKAAWSATWDAIAAVFDSVMGAIKNKVGQWVDWIVDKVQRAAAAIGSLGTPGSAPMGAYPVPKGSMQRGGIVPSLPGGAGLFLLHSGERVIPAAQPAAAQGGGMQIGSVTINVDGARDPQATARAVAKVLFDIQRYNRTPAWAVATP